MFNEEASEGTCYFGNKILASLNKFLKARSRDQNLRKARARY